MLQIGRPACGGAVVPTTRFRTVAPRPLRTAANEGNRSRQVSARAATTETAWKAWTDALPQWKSSTTNPPAVNTADRKALAEAVKAAATSFKPKPTLKVPDIDDLPEVPKNLHKRLELVARVQLAHYLELPLSAVTASLSEYTTTDIAAACSVAGIKLTQGGKKMALLSLVVTETVSFAAAFCAWPFRAMRELHGRAKHRTLEQSPLEDERQMTWSRLEGLLLHWAVSRKPPPAEKWELPPRGWKTLPDTTVDAGGAWQTGLEKHPLPEPDGTLGPQPMYTMLAALPLDGPLAEGGLIFVLKSGSTGQNTKWLKDAGTQKDFFLDVQSFKELKATS